MADIPEKKSRVLTDLEAFDEVFPCLVDDLTKQGLKDDQITSAMAWFKQVRIVKDGLNLKYSHITS